MVEKMEIVIKILDTTEDSFTTVFTNHKDNFLNILSNSFPKYYGDDYQLKRIIADQSVLFLAFVDNVLVGVSYIKKNLRRGGTAIFPEQYRGLGIAEKLVLESLNLFPNQYSILRADNQKMISLLEKLGFKKAITVQEIEKIVKDEFVLFSDFKIVEDRLVFNRYSARRETLRESLTLLHTFYLV